MGLLMASTIDTAFVNQFRDNVMFLAQQRESKLKPLVRQETFTGEFLYLDQLGALDAQQKTTRHKATPVMDQPHSRRRVGIETWQVADLIDNDDRLKMLLNPESNYSKSFAMSLGRKYDDLMIAAATGTAQSGKTGATAVTLPAGQVVGDGTQPMSLAYLLDAKYRMDAADVEAEDRVAVVSAKALSQLLNDTKITSADYNTVKALVRGEIDTFVGFKFVMSTRLAVPAANKRDCVFFQRQGIALGINQDAITRISERPDMSYATQVYMELNAGAVRMEEVRVVKVQILET